MTTEAESFYITGGTLRHDAPSYVERQADRELRNGLLAGEFCYVLTSRQMGKSSLMVRTASRLRESATSIVVLDLTAVGQNLTPEQWYDGLLMRLGQQMELEDELETNWTTTSRLGPCQRFFAALRDVVLPARPGPLVVFVDEIDSVRSLPFSTDEFFAAIRECYNRRGEEPEFRRLTFCLLGVATPSDLIRDTRTTPFNIGRRVELNDFTEIEAAPLAQGLRHLTSSESSLTPLLRGTEANSGARRAKRLLSRILYWTGGHPYLTQRFCRAVAERSGSLDSAGVDRLCEDLFFSSRAQERDDNLLFVRERLLRSEADVPSLLELYLKVRRGKRMVDDDTNSLISVMRLSGIVKAANGCLIERNRIYSRVFDAKWVQAHLPDADVRRQKAAFQRGVIRTTAIAGVVVATLAVAVLFALNQADQARMALAESNFSQAKARRTSGQSGQRYESLEALRTARRYYPNEAALRDELLACLALIDLREKTNGILLPRDLDRVELNLEAGIAAAAERTGTIAMHRLDDGKLLGSLPGFGRPVRNLRFAPSGTVLLAEYGGVSRNQLVAWDWQQTNRLFSLEHGIHAEALDFSADGRRLAIGQAGGRILIYSLPGGEPQHELELRMSSGLPRVPQVVRFDPSGEWLAEASLDDAYVQIWKVGNDASPLRLHHADVVQDLAWSPNGDVLASACRDSQIYLWRTNAPERSQKLVGHERAVIAISFNQHGTLLASLGLDETVRLWVLATGRGMTRRLDRENYERVRFSTADDLLIAMDQRQTTGRVWETFGKEYIVLRIRGSPIDRLKTIDFSPDGQWLAATTGDRATVWDSRSGRELVLLNLPYTHAAWFSTDSRRLVASTAEGLFNIGMEGQDQGSRLTLRTGPAQRVPNVTNELGAMSPTLDRQKAAIVHQDEVLFVPLESASRPQKFPVDIHYHRLALHPSASWMAAMIQGSNSIHLWNTAEENPARPPAQVTSSEYFGFSPGGEWLVTCWFGKFDFYRVGEWKKPAFSVDRTPSSQSHQHAPIAFTRDGSMLALASSRDTVQLFAMPEAHQTRPRLIATLESPDRGSLEMMAFSPDSRQLAAATKDQTVQLWNLALLRSQLDELKLAGDWPAYP